MMNLKYIYVLIVLACVSCLDVMAQKDNTAVNDTVEG